MARDEKVGAPGNKRLRKPAANGVTLQHVAERAGVSTATVSRYLSRPDQVRQARRARIEQAVADLGYIPHGAARALASSRTQTIGAIVPTLDNAIFAQGIHAFQRRLQEAGYTLFIASHGYSLLEERIQAETLLARGVDGMLLIGLDHDPGLYRRLDKLGTPYVSAWSYDRRAERPCIGFDNHKAALAQAGHLLDLGHRRFGVLAGVIRDNDRARDRLEGVRTALNARGVALTPAQVQECPYELGASRAAAKRLLALDPRPTAIVCGNDVIAYGALLECQASGVDVPAEISIVGFDDLPLSEHLQPALTTVHVPSETMGRKAAEFLLARLGGEDPPDKVELAANLILRASTAPR
ncbi:MAG: LacI family DNA-binding transcriptional regulator [Marivibrio sp.]|uniref:LacI family DNA-binding transcriptional regulator n=1 Tax=Marivibrio sp. TaxID=2039719 RepID=UPI0032ECA1E5